MQEESPQERYVSICFLSEPHSADQLSGTLEAAGIPVIIQHLAIGGENGFGGNGNGADAGHLSQKPSRSNVAESPPEEFTALGFRLLVPMHQAQMALKLWERYRHQHRRSGIHQFDSESLAEHADKASRKAA
jgi:hypothetical protein